MRRYWTTVAFSMNDRGQPMGQLDVGTGNTPSELIALGTGDYVAVQVMSLDDVDFAELTAAPVRYADGRNNNWMEVPAEIRHL